MIEESDRSVSAAAAAAAELAELSAQVEAARAVLIRLLQDVVEAESRLSSSHAAQLLEANEQLVITALRAQTDAETAARTLNEVSRSAELDSLTELPNRVLLIDRMAHAIANAKRHRGRVAVLFLDLDNFKQINDTFGHAVGDEVLQHAARALASAVRESDTVSRHGGDEFLILVSELGEATDLVVVAEKAIVALATPVEVAGHEIRLSASIGISVYPDDAEDAHTLIERADAAMYRAKRYGVGSYAFHGQEAVASPAPLSAPRPSTRPSSSVDHERRHQQLREANEQLVLTALSAQELQAAAQHALRRQTEFLAVVANELSNPLAPIRIATALLGRVRSDEPLLPQVQSIVEHQVRYLSQLVAELVDVSRLDAATLQFESRAVDIVELIAQVVGASRSTIDRRGQQVDIHVPDGPLDVRGDPLRLAQVFTNLLDNASKYTHDGGRIEISVAVAGEDIMTTVADSGIGISPQALPDIFSPFVQDPHAIGFNGVGPGIGLTVVRELVEAHGGSVVATSAGRGFGSRFAVTLPRARTAPPAG